MHFRLYFLKNLSIAVFGTAVALLFAPLPMRAQMVHGSKAVGGGGAGPSATLEDSSGNSDFGELSRVTPDSLKGTEKLGSETCQVCRRAGKAARIMETSRLPLRFENQEMSIIYTYASAPMQDFVLPGKYSERYKQVMDA